MKKRLLSTLLALCMALALLPGTALAATRTSLTVTPTGIRADTVSNSEGYGIVKINGNLDDYEMWQIMDEELRAGMTNPQFGLIDRSGKFLFPYRENTDVYGRNISYYYSDGIVSLAYDLYSDYGDEGFLEYYNLDGSKPFTLEGSHTEEPGMIRDVSYEGAVMSDGYAVVKKIDSWASYSTSPNLNMGSAASTDTLQIIDKTGAVTGELPEAFSEILYAFSYGYERNTELALNTRCGEGLFSYSRLKWDETDDGFPINVRYEGVGYMDVTGKTVINLESRGYKSLGCFSSGRAAVVTNNGVGFIDKTGTVVIPCIYDLTGNFSSDGLVCAKKDGKWGYIDKAGKTVIPFEYDDAYGAGGGRAAVVKNGKCGLVDYFNNVVLPLEYDDISSYEGGVAYAIKDGYLYIISETTPNDSVIYFTNEKELDDGMLYDFAITNYTQETMRGYYALLTYAVYDDNSVGGQFIEFNLGLEPGRTASGQLKSIRRNLSLHKLCWIKFDSVAERDAFFQDSNIFDWFEIAHNTQNFPGVYAIRPELATLDWLSNKVGIKLG